MPQNVIDPSILGRLDPEYVAFHNTHLLDYVPIEHIPWDPKIREGPAVPGASQPQEVGSIRDFSFSKTSIRTFTPKSERPPNGWPALIWLHGGGWTLGNIDSESSFMTQIVNLANCVVISVNYRLAPEIKYPAAVEDAVESLKWVVSHGPREISIDSNRIAVGGCSSGGNLAAVLALKAVELKIPLKFQLLVVPVCDNTASVENLWKDNEKAPWLSPARMEWFKNNYLPNREDWTKWDASPTFAPVELLNKAPKAWLGVCEIDILKAEGIEYGQKLQKAGVEVEIKVYPGAPHPILGMDGVLQVGRNLIADAGYALTRAFEESS